MYPKANLRYNKQQIVFNIKIPKDFIELGKFFSKYNNEYKAVIIPLEGNGLLDERWRIDNKTITSSTPLINQFVPIPLIRNRGVIPINYQRLMIEYAKTNPVYFIQLLRLFNIKYIVVNHYSKYAGEIESLISNLAEVHKLKQIGNFTIYELNFTFPLLYMTNNVVLTYGNSFNEMLRNILEYLEISDSLGLLKESLPVFINESENIHLKDVNTYYGLMGSLFKDSFHIYNSSNKYMVKGKFVLNTKNCVFLDPRINITYPLFIYLDAIYKIVNKTIWHNYIIKDKTGRTILIQVYINIISNKFGISIREYDYNFKNVIAYTGKSFIFKNTNISTYKLATYITSNNIIAELKTGSSCYKLSLYLPKKLGNNLKFYVCSIGGLLFGKYEILTIHKYHVQKRIIKNNILYWKQLNPTTYLITIRSNKTSVFLVFEENYHPGWHLIPLGRNIYTITHIKVNDFANGWYIKSNMTVNGEFLLFFEPQKYYYLGLVLQITLFIISMIGILIIFLYKQIKLKLN